MITDRELADELVKLATLLRMGLKPEVPPHVRYLLHACHHEIEKASAEAADFKAGAAQHRTITRPRAHFLTMSRSDAYHHYMRNHRGYHHRPGYFDPEYEIGFRVIDRDREAQYLCSEQEQYNYDPSMKPWKFKQW